MKRYGVEVSLTFTKNYYVEASNKDEAEAYATNLALDELSIITENESGAEGFDYAKALAVWEDS